jgi:carotenoid phi-ring synthase / carotenoid chi-ring synthase
MSSNSTSSDRFPVVVIGAGLAGLSAAVHLAERGIAPLVLEADTLYAGGRLQGGAPETFTYGGRMWSFDSEHGMHALWGDYDNMRTMMKRFGLADPPVSADETWIHRWGEKVKRAEAGAAVRTTWLPAPFHYLQLLLSPRFWSAITPMDLLSLPGFLVSILMTVGIDPIREQIAWDGVGIPSYFGGWSHNLRATFIGLARNLLAAPTEAISLTAFIAALRFYTMQRRDSWRPAYLPDNAHRSLVMPLIKHIETCEGVVMLGARAGRLERVEGGWRIGIEDVQRGRRSLLAERVILAVDAPAAKRLLMGSADTAEEAEKLRLPRAMRNAVVRIWYDSQPYASKPGGMFTGDFKVDNFFWLDRLRPDFAEWAASTGGSCIEMHMYATDEVLDQADEALIGMGAEEALRAFPEMRGHSVHSAVRRNEPTQTIFRVPTKESLWIDTPWEGISACGDWIGADTSALWMERCVITGLEAANRVLRAHGLEPFGIVPGRRPEAFAWVLGGLARGVRFTLGRGMVWIARSMRWR